MRNSLTKTFLGAATAASLLLALAPAARAGILLDTSDLLDGETIGSYFSGAKDLNGNAGPKLGVTFSPDATNFVGAPSNALAAFTSAPAGGSNIIVFGFGQGSVTFASPFFYDVSFYYSSLTGGTVEIESGGTDIGAINLAANNPDASSCPPGSAQSFCTWTQVTVEFNGPADTLDFSNAGVTGFADLSVPEPASLALFASGFAAFGLYRRQNRA